MQFKLSRQITCVVLCIAGLVLIAPLVALSPVASAQPSGLTGAGGASFSDTGLSYQSYLTVKGQPANGLYDFQFTLYDALEGGRPLAPTQIVLAVQVESGAFTVGLDWENVFNGRQLYVQVGVRPNGANASFTQFSPRQAIDRSALAAAVTSEFWKLGVTSESGAAYSAVVGRAASAAAAFRSNRGATDMYYIFPAPGISKTVQSARFYLLSRTGAYSGAATMTLETLAYSGTVQHSVSVGGVDVQAAAPGAWTTMDLSADLNDLEIAPGEFLAFHFHLDGAPSGDLDVRPLFEVRVQ